MKGKYPCPECGERATQLFANSSLVVSKGILRGKRCPKGHTFVTVELPIELGSLTWNELLSRIM